MLSKLCQPDGVDDGSFSLAFLLHIVMRLGYLQRWDFYPLALTLTFSGSIALIQVLVSTLHVVGQMLQVFTKTAFNYSLMPVLLLVQTLV